MRIGIVCYPSVGGSGIVATELGRALSRRGHQVHFITYDVPFRLDRYERNVSFHEVEVPAYPLFKYPPYLLALTNKIVEVCRMESLDILHVHYAIPHAAAGLLARQITGGRLRLVTTLHGTDITLVGSNPSFAEIVAHSINQSDAVTAVSEYLRGRTRDVFDISRRIELIPNFINVEEYRRKQVPCLRRRFAPNGEAVVVHISNFRPVKRVDVVVETFERIRRRLPARLLMVGDGPEVPRACAVATRLGVREHTCFLGRQERVIDLLSTADLFLLPSASESFGLAALEAMACGVPVVASRVAGLPELIEDGRGGCLLDPNDVEGMAARSVELLSDRALHASAAADARRRAETLFSSERIVPMYEELYERVLAAAPGGDGGW